jgi:hypothetical protein
VHLRAPAPGELNKPHRSVCRVYHAERILQLTCLKESCLQCCLNLVETTDMQYAVNNALKHCLVSCLDPPAALFTAFEADGFAQPTAVSTSSWLQAALLPRNRAACRHCACSIGSLTCLFQPRLTEVKSSCQI